MKHLTDLIKVAETLLSNPILQVRSDRTIAARNNVIKELFWAEQTYAALRDNKDHKPAWDKLDRATVDANDALYTLRTLGQ
jgi:hypothetical protein